MTQFTQIQAVTFDVGGTLIRPWPSVGHVYAEVAARHGVESVPPEALNRQFRAAWRQLKTFNHGREEWSALVDQTFAGLSVEPPSRTFFPELYDRFREPDAWQVFDDVVPTLNELAALGINLGIISNWDDRLVPLLDRLGLSKYFQAIIVSCDVGFPKPSPVIFEQAAKKLGVPPGSVLHVGDSLNADVAGAKAAGFESVLIDRSLREDEPGRIKSLRRLEGMF